MSDHKKTTLKSSTMFTDVKGSGGGGGSSKGGSSSRQAIEAPNTLRSKAIARVLIAYSEGPVGGINSYKNIYLDETPLENPDGTINFPGVVAAERHGAPDQTAIEGFGEAENTIQVNTDLKVATGPVVRAISAATIDSIRIVMTFPSLVYVDTKTGDQTGTSVSFRIEVKDDAVGVWESRGDQTVTGKCVSPYQKAYRIPRPSGTAKWSFRITRLTPDPTVTTLQNATQVSTYSEIEESRQVYPNTALVSIKVDTSLFGNGIPTVSVKVDGVQVRVPANYNQDNLRRGATAYGGVWNGDWKYESTNNPVWHIYELITSKRFGMGIDGTYIDKFALYALARYCDGVDSSGVFFGVPDGFGGWRPRFTVQTQINSQEDAMSMIQTIVGSMRGLAYWGAGVVQLNTDRPKTSVKMFGPENVIDGKFTYSGTEAKERYTEANVTYNNPKDFFRQDIVTFYSEVAAARYPRNVLNVTKWGCANEAEALMYGKWMVDTSITQTETINFTSGIEGGVIRPGDVFEVADPKYQGGKWSGRVMPNSTQTILRTDAPVTLTAGKSYSAKIVDSSGQTMMTGTLTNDKNGQPDNAFFISGLPSVPTVPHMWIISGDDIKARQYTCMAITEQDDFTYEIVGVNYDPNKFLRVEENIILDDDPYSKINVADVAPPTNMQFKPVSRTDAILGPRNDLQVTWSPSNSAYVTSYEVYHRVSNGQFTRVGLTDVADITIPNIVPGIHEVQVSALNVAGRHSPALLGSYTFQYGGASDLAPPVDLYIKGRTDGIFNTPDATFTWRDNPLNNGRATAVTGWEIRITSDDAAKTVLFTQYIGNPTTTEFTYTRVQNQASGLRRDFRIEVRAADGLGRRSDPAALASANPAPAVPGGIKWIPFFTAYRLQHNLPTESDAVGTLIFASKTSDFVASPSTLVYEGSGTFHDVEAESKTKYYVKFAVYDTFSRDPAYLNVSPESIVETVNDEFFVPAPETPQNLVLTSTAKNGVVTLTATWDALVTASYTSFEVALAQGTGNFVGGFLTGSNSFSQVVTPLTNYTVRVRAKNNTKDSTFSVQKSITTVAADGTGTIQNPPSPITNLVAKNSFKAIFLTWDIPTTGGPIDDFNVFESTTNDFSEAIVIGTTGGSSFTRGGLNSGDSRYYWVTSNGPGGTSARFPTTTTGILGATQLLATADFQNLSIVNALIADATIDSAKIVSLDAAKIKTDSVLAGTILVSDGDTNTSLATTKNNAGQAKADAAAAKASATEAERLANLGISDAAKAQTKANQGVTDAATARQIADNAKAIADLEPTTRINAGTTRIDPGKISIFGTTTLASWRNGGDNTKIEGGNIAANTIRANSIRIGLRGINTTGLDFQMDGKTRYVSWGAGNVFYTADSGAVAGVTVAGGGFTPSGNTAYAIVWYYGESQLRVSTDINFAMNNENYVCFATYDGYSYAGIVVNYSATVIDGDRIITNSIKANRIEANTIGVRELTAGEIITSTANIRTGIIQSVHIADAAITNAKISGTLSSSNYSDGDTVTPGSANGWRLVKGTGADNGKLYANNIEVRDDRGVLIMATGGVNWGKVYGTPAAFPTSWENTSGKPYFGAFSSLDALNSSNISSYISAAAIGTAYIQNGAITNALISDAQITTLKVANYQVSSFVMGERGPEGVTHIFTSPHPGFDWNAMAACNFNMLYAGRFFAQTVNTHFSFFQNFGTYYRARAAMTQQLIWRPPWAGGNWGSVADRYNMIDLNGNGIYEVSYQFPMCDVLAFGGEYPAGFYEWWYRIIGESNGLTDSNYHFNFNNARVLVHYSYR